MKNIHLLSTDIPSILVKIYNDVNRETFTLKLDVKVNDSFKEYVNIYITSDERPNTNEYYIIDDIHEVLKNDSLKFIDNNCKKIILTTDHDLIKDGVQSIDDDFLEWFVKNPSCDNVEVVDGIYFDDVEWISCYKIIIPKEEPTFYTKKCKCMIFEPNCFTGMCKNCGGILKEETKPKTMLESLQEYLKNTPKEKVLEDWNEFQHLDEEGITVKEFLENQKQETLEEAAKKYSENWEETTGLDYENTVPSEVNKLDFINGAKWQQERMYSEEEVHKILGSYSANKEVFNYKYTYNKWFEQFKK